MIQQSIFAILSANAGIAAVVSSRIFPVVVPEGQSVWPCITFQLISGSSEPTLDNKQLQTARVQIDAWGDSYLAAQNAQATVSSAMDGYTGSIGGQRLLIANSGITQDSFETDARIYRVMVEYEISFA